MSYRSRQPFLLFGAALILGSCVLARTGQPLAEGLIQVSETTFQSGGHTIGVERFAPSGRGQHPAVLVLHSSGGTRWFAGDAMREYARALATEGNVAFVVHYFDRTGDTRTDDAEEDVKFPAWRSTLQDAITFAQRDTSVQRNRIGVLGVSLGGYMAIALGSIDGRVRAVSVVSGGMFDSIRGHLIRMPATLLQHGDADGVVPVGLAHEVDNTLDRLKSRHAMVIYPGQGHHFDASVDSIVRCRAVGFLSGELQGSRIRPHDVGSLIPASCNTSRLSAEVVTTSEADGPTRQ